MKLDKLLEYQEVDIQLRRQLDVIERSDDAKKIEQAKNEFAVAKKAVEDSERAATTLVEFFAACKKYEDEIEKRLSDLELIVENDTEDDVESIFAEIEKLKKKLTEIENKISDRKNKSETVIKAYTTANERGRKIRDFHSKAKERQDTLKSKIEPEIDRLRAKLAEIEPHIEPDIMKQYKNLTAERKYPAFVEVYADGKTYSCRGCGIALSQTNSSVLNDKNYCVCESCRRIIYKKLS